MSAFSIADECVTHTRTHGAAYFFPLHPVEVELEYIITQNSYDRATSLTLVDKGG